MGLDVGIITIQYLERPHGVAYEFAWELAYEASANGYMAGEGNNWGTFTQRQVLRMLDDFAEREGLGSTAKSDILAWVRSLPWDWWNDYHGGIIELHFNW